MDYKKAIEYVHSIPRFVRPLGNTRLGELLTLMGDPHKELKYVHVAGTNGKGSVCAMLAEILRRAGYKTGLFTSPYIEVFNERIRVNGEMIGDHELAEYISRTAGIAEKNGIEVSEFAFITAAAFMYFRDRGCDIVVLETGMGGRLDATNIIPAPEAAVITSIGLDHTQYLGESIEEIAKEKCGIIKSGSAVVSASNTRVKEIIEEAASEAGDEFTVCDAAVSKPGRFVYKTWSYHLSLRGEYQAENASVVLETVRALRRRGYAIPERAVIDGFEKTVWKARYEFVAKNIVIDGGHNIDGIRALKRSLADENKPVTLVIAMMKDKAYELCIHTIVSAAKTVVATELDMERALGCDEIKRICDDAGVECTAEPDPEKAIEKAMELAGNGLICICGSLYLAGEAERILKDKGIFNF